MFTMNHLPTGLEPNQVRLQFRPIQPPLPWGQEPRDEMELHLALPHLDDETLDSVMRYLDSVTGIQGAHARDSFLMSLYGRWNPVIKTLLAGVHDPDSPLSLLRGHEEDALRGIYEHVVLAWRASVTRTPSAVSAGRTIDSDRPVVSSQYAETTNEEYVLDPLDTRRAIPAINMLHPFNRNESTVLGRKKADQPQIAFSPCADVRFPPSAHSNVNMMPFIMGKKRSLPRSLQPYYDTIIAKCPVQPSEFGKVVYLTIQESFVEAGETQRRPGFHIESPVALKESGKFTAGLEVESWGAGMAHSPDELHGGLFIASSMGNTTAVWNAIVDPSYHGVVDTHGGIEMLRPYLGPGHKLPANLLVWMTDRTPHEALPQAESGYRQFFRLVTSDISVWYAAHSTSNPRVPLPDHVRVIRDDKFEQEADESVAKDGKYSSEPDDCLIL